MAGPIPTKKIPQLTALGAPLQGPEQLEIWVANTSRRITARDFVLPIDSVITLAGMGATLPGSRQLVSSPTIQVTDNGAGSTVQLDALGTGALPGNPTSLIGLTPINGVSVNWMPSDAAPALSQSIAPNWTSLHTFAAGILAAANDPFVRFLESDAAADNRVWDFIPMGEQFRGRVGNDALGAFVNWIEVDRTANIVDSINLLATSVQANGSPILTTATAFADPTASLGLAPVNGVASTAMRSDAAPALDQGIAPDWTAQHIFSLSGATNAAIFVSSVQPQIDLNETDAAANNRRWRWEVQGEQLLGRTVNDANSATVTWLAVDRTLNIVDSIAFTATALTWNGNPLLSTATAFANPSALIGLVAVNGTAATAPRSDAAPALSQAIVPVWTGLHRFSAGADVFQARPAAYSDATLYPLVVTSNLNQRNELIVVQVGGGTAGRGGVVAGVDGEGSVAMRGWGAAYVGGLAGGPSGSQGVLHTGIAVPLTIGTNDTARMIFGGSGDINPLTTITVGPNCYFINNAANGFRLRNAADSTGLLTIADNGDSFFLSSGLGSFVVGSNATLGLSGVMEINQPAAAGYCVAMKSADATRLMRLWNTDAAGDSAFVQFQTEAAPTTRGSITYNRAGGVVAYNTTSDVKRKRNVVDAPEAGTIIDRIRVRSFDWENVNIHVDHWLVAQELYGVFPLAVTEGDEHRDWAIDPSKLVPLMVKEMQSLRRRVAVVENVVH